MKSNNLVDVIRFSDMELVDLPTSLRRSLTAGLQWVVSILTGNIRQPTVKTFASFVGASEFAKKNADLGCTVRIDSTKCILKILNTVPLQPFSADELVDFHRIKDFYPNIKIPFEVLSSQALLLDGHFPIIEKKAFNYFSSSFAIWLVKRKGNLSNSNNILRGAKRCVDILEGIVMVDKIATGETNREAGETVILMATGGPGLASKNGTFFYKIEQGATMDSRGRLPVEQLVDPLDEFYEEHLYFSRYDRKLKKLTFYSDDLHTCKLSEGVQADGLKFWCPRPFFIKSETESQ
jgi:hypothetical protein